MRGDCVKSDCVKGDCVKSDCVSVLSSSLLPCLLLRPSIQTLSLLVLASANCHQPSSLFATIGPLSSPINGSEQRNRIFSVYSNHSLFVAGFQEICTV